MLVMGAHYRSAGLTRHQREWTDAGWYHGCNCVMSHCKFCRTLREKARCILRHCISSASLRYARGQHGQHGAPVMLSVRLADPLSSRRVGSCCRTAEKNHELFLGWEGGREVVGWRNRESLTCPLAAVGGEKCRTIYVCISFLRAVVVVLVVSVIVLIHFVLVIFLLLMYVQQARVFSA